MEFRAGEIDARQAAMLNELWREVQALKAINVAAPLQMSKPSGIPSISLGATISVPWIYEVTSSNANGVTSGKRLTAYDDNTIQDLTPAANLTTIMSASGASLDVGSAIEVFPIPEREGWYWGFAGGGGGDAWVKITNANLTANVAYAAVTSTFYASNQTWVDGNTTVYARGGNAEGLANGERYLGCLAADNGNASLGNNPVYVVTARGGNNTFGNGSGFLGQVTAAGNSTVLGCATAQTIGAANAVVAISPPTTIRFPNSPANTTFPVGQRLGFISIPGNVSNTTANIPIPACPADAGNHGWVTNGNDSWNGVKATTSKFVANGGISIAQSISGGFGFSNWNLGNTSSSLGNSSVYGPSGFYLIGDSWSGVGTTPYIQFRYNNALSIWMFEFYSGSYVACPVYGSWRGSFTSMLANGTSFSGVGGGNGTALTQGALCHQGIIINAGNGTPFGTGNGNGSVTSVDGASTWGGVSLSGGAITTSGTLTITLDDASSARTDLDVYSKAEVDAAIAAAISGLSTVSLEYLDHASDPQTQTVYVP